MENRQRNQVRFVSGQDISEDSVSNRELSLDFLSVKLIQYDETVIHKCDEERAAKSRTTKNRVMDDESRSAQL
jgi:hypothetical protein